MDTATTSSLAQADQSLGQLAVQIPGATAVFRRLKLDFCCGGQQPLEAACAAKGLDPQAVLGELHTLQQTEAAPEAPAPAALIAHILRRYHAVHRQQLPELIRMAQRVEAVHRDHPEVPRGLAAHLETMAQELHDHLDKEEQILFPLLERGGHPMVVHPIGAMRQEHVAHGAQIARLAELTREHQAPAGACNTWQALCAGTARLTEDLIAHIHLENKLLFPAFEGQAQH